ncbi:cupin domain-containing protein [Qingshengfaniella alkalisoli]|uniref:Cupin domain-containing protein n=1 Tax=Qingshengfaniella alkalisoli TaxID=2599296 RepID=A0A5B8ISG8_9RHOB|nr:cupin domain-containing protein [Qingshengfaniella alkalisoli]QDY68544.1 cupin domain-containing protein [Qingshengfaniella alkalisoli]
MILRKGSIAEKAFPSRYPEPYGAGSDGVHGVPLGATAGLTQFGVYVERLDPGMRGSLKHWHENEDEFLYVLEGVLTVTEADEHHVLHPGDACGWPADEGVGHTIRNDGDTPVRYLIVGSRLPDETCHYPGCDLLSVRREGKGQFTRLDGTPYPPRDDE